MVTLLRLNQYVKPLLAALAALCLMMSSGRAAGTVKAGQVDFGHIGSDFKVYHEFIYVNKTPTTVTLKTDDVPCECSKVTLTDSTVAPGDSARIRVEFDTIYLFGETIKTFTLATTDPSAPIIEYEYVSHIGRWLGGIKPEPLSAFLLPGQTTKTIFIPNLSVDKLTVSVLGQADDYYALKVKNSRISKGEKAQIELTLTKSLATGTYYSSFRVQAMLPDDVPVILSVPVKIVRY